jgi:hypothetical protein
MFLPDPKAPAIAPLLAARRADLAAKALQVRLLAEQAAVGQGGPARPDVPAYSEQVVPWVRQKIEKADGERRLGQDLLFASVKASWTTAAQHLDRAAAGYRAAQKEADTVRRALWERDRALAQLPWYVRYLGEQSLPPDRQTEALDACRKVHELSRLLDQPARSAAQAVELEKTLALWERKKLADLEWMKAIYRKNVLPEFESTQDSWHKIDALLRVPVASPEREKLIQDSQRLAWDLYEQGKRGGGAQGAEQTLKAVRAEARWQARLALASAVEGEEEWRTLDRQVPGREEGGERALLRIGKELAARLVEGARQAQKGVGEASRATDLARAVAQLRQGSRLARQVDGWAVDSHLQDNPVEQERKLLLHDLLCDQAERAYLDHWAAERPTTDGSPYYRVAGRLFLRDAERLAGGATSQGVGKKPDPRLARVRQVRARLDAQQTFTVEWSATGEAADFHEKSARLHLTDEAYLRRFYRLKGPADVPGHPVRWVECEAGLRPAPAEQARQVGTFGRNFLSDIQAARTARDPQERQCRHTVKGFFRGRLASATTAVTVYREPDTLIAHAAPTRKGRLAVQVEARLFEQHVAAKSAVAIVLDCSGSMNDPATGSSRPRWEDAKRAVRDMLRDLPRGVRVSLHVFGAKECKEYKKYGGIALVWPPRPWDDDRAVVKRRLAELDELTPRSYTPLIRTLLMARDRLPTHADFKGRRSIVVMTDGGDSTFYRKDDPDADLKDRGKLRTIRQLLVKEFSGAYKDVQLNVVGFDIKDNDLETPAERKAFVELDGALKAVGGTFTNVKNVAALTSQLRKTLLRMSFLVDADIRRPGYDAPGDERRISHSDRRENNQWLEPLSGEYTVRLPNFPGLTQRVRIRPGDALVLDLVSRPPSVGFRRSIYARVVRANQGFCRETKGKDRWVLAALENYQDRGGGALHSMATLEQDQGVAFPDNHVQVVHPTWTWFELQGATDQQPASPLRVFSLEGYPAPAWGLNVAAWPRGKPVGLRAWWTGDDLSKYIAATWVRQEGRKPLLELSEEPWPTRDSRDEVVLESVRLEECRILQPHPTFTHNLTTVQRDSCLVVRLRYPPERGPFFVRLGERDLGGGQAHRFYERAGKYTGVFWPVTADDVRRIRELHLFSVRELKAQGQGRDLNLGKPSYTSPRPEIP